MASKRYPDIINETIEEIAKWVREVTRTREEDIGDADQTRTIAETNDARLPAAGTSGNLLTSDGTNWISSSPTSTSGMVLLAVKTASNSATLDFASYITTAHSTYIFEIDDLRPATDGDNLYFRTSTDNGATYDAGASDYSYSIYRQFIGTSSIEGNTVSAGTTKIFFPDTGNAAAEGISGYLILRSPLGTARNKAIEYGGVAQYTDGVGQFFRGYGLRLSTEDIDAARFLFAGGNITSGKIRLYGMLAA